LRVGFLVAVAMAVSLSVGQSIPVVTFPHAIPGSWDRNPDLGGGAHCKMHFEIRPTGSYIDGPRLTVPCVGLAESAFMEGWPAQLVDYWTLASGAQIRAAIGDPMLAGAGLDAVNDAQDDIEDDLLDIYRVSPGEGSGPRKSEEVYKYRYQKVDLYVWIGQAKSPLRLDSYYIPDREALLLSTRPCGSKPVKENFTYGLLGGLVYGSGIDEHLPTVTKEPTGYIGAVFSPDTAGEIKKSGFRILGQDINTVAIQEPNFMETKISLLYFPTGTVLIPSVSGVQSMILTEPLFLAPGTQWLASVDPMANAQNLAVHCLEIDKAPPNPSVTFTPSAPADPTLRNLASFSEKSAIKGPWDQARMWIYTDKATLERVNKRLAIGCPPGMYVRSLWEVQTMGGFTKKDFENAEMFRPEFLGAVCNKKEAITWFARVLVKYHSDALIKYFEGGGKEFAELMTSTNPLAQDQFTRTVEQLRSHRKAKIRIAALKFLDAQDVAALKKAIGKPLPKWDRHLSEQGEEAELGKKLQAKFAS